MPLKPIHQQVYKTAKLINNTTNKEKAKLFRKTILAPQNNM